jgi:hypothetical protein
VADVNASGATLILPDMTTPTNARHKRLASANIAAGDRVLCVKTSGTIVILDKIV